MNNVDIFKGILFIIANFCCFGFAFQQYKKGNFKMVFGLIILGGLMLRLWCIFDPFLHVWDERYHALVAKNLGINPLKPTLYFDPILSYDFRNWSSNHVWLHKQPMSLWIIALSLKLFGNYEWAVRIPSIIFSLISVGFTCKIAHFLTKSVPIALLAAFFQSVNGFVIEVASGRTATDHVDNFFFFFIELTVFLTVVFAENPKKRYLIFIGISLAFALLTKSFPALIVLPIFILLTKNISGWQRSIVHVFAIILVASIVYLPWQYYIFTTYPNEANWEHYFNFLHLTQAVEGQAGEWWWHFDNARKIWNELIFIALIWSIFHGQKNRNDVQIWALATWIFVPYIFFSAVGTKMSAYVLFTAPAVFIVEAKFLFDVQNNYLKYPFLRKILVYSFIILTVRYCYERVKPFQKDKYYEHVLEGQKVKNLSKSLSKNQKNVIFNLKPYVECMFYHDNTVAYPFTPNAKIIDSLSQLNYKIFIVSEEQKDSNLTKLKAEFILF